MISGNKKADPKIAESLEQRVLNYKSAIHKAEEILTLKEHPGWEHLSKKMAAQLERAEYELDNFEQMSERDILAKLKERKDFRLIVNALENVESEMSELYRMLSDVQVTINKRKETSGIGNT